MTFVTVLPCFVLIQPQENSLVAASLDVDASDDTAAGGEQAARLQAELQIAMRARDVAAVKRLMAERATLSYSAVNYLPSLWSTREWRVVLADFDLSRTEADVFSSAVTTRVGGGGTPGYIAPEVFRGARPTKASDIFSLGMCLLMAFAADDVTKDSLISGGDESRTTSLSAILNLCNATTLGSMLATEPADRPSASELLSRNFFSGDSAREATMRVCVVEACREKVFKDKGVTCSDQEGSHFVCDECLANHVRASTDNEALRLLEDHGGRVRCICHPPPLGGCCQTYSDQAIAQHIPQADFATYFRAKQALVEIRIGAELEAGVQRRIDKEVARIAALSEAERRANEIKKHIIERILTLACPQCGAAFAEELDGEMGFNGCFALTCSRAGCGCGFCAYCLKACGRDAHTHVQHCEHGEGLFPKPARGKFKAAQKARRERMLRQYLATLPTGERDMAVIEVVRELNDLGLTPEEFL